LGLCFTEHIVGLSRIESDAILDMLCRHSGRAAGARARRK